MPQLSRRVGTFTDSVIRRMTRISDETPYSINLSQGFPDFDPPKEILEALKKNAEGGPQHQYSITFGAENLRRCISEKYSPLFGRTIDPDKEIVVTCGSTEAMMASMMTVCNPGDKVIVFSPFYENYGADAILSGADPIYVNLTPPEYSFDRKKLEDAFRQGVKAIIVCNPSNPCGKVFTKEEQKAWLSQNTGVSLGSDAFFPFGDNIERAHKSGVSCIAQPGGSIRDDHVISTCNKYGIAMAFTGIRLFHH